MIAKMVRFAGRHRRRRTPPGLPHTKRPCRCCHNMGFAAKMLGDDYGKP